MPVEKKMIPVLEGQTYFLCRCSESASYPFCDGAHKGSGIKSLPYTAPRTMSIVFENGYVMEEQAIVQE